MTDAQFINFILDAYSLSEEAITTLSESIINARLLSMQATYRHGQKLVGLSPNWIPTRAARRNTKQKASENAKGIAQTFRDLLRSFLERLFETRKAQLLLPYTASWQDVFGNIREAVRQITTSVRKWTDDFIPWKSSQVSTAETGTGLFDGTMQFARDIIEAEKSGKIEGDNGETFIDRDEMDVGVDEIGIQILPTNSSSDYCKDYAGRKFPFPEALEIPSFPSHPNCIHYPVMIRM